MEMSTPPDEAELGIAGRAIADALAKGATDDAYDRVVIAATPKLIGAIRPLLSDTVNRRDIIEIHHRLLQLSDKELAERLTKEDVIGPVRS
jgi:protein required for attachment to host cells